MQIEPEQMTPEEAIMLEEAMKSYGVPIADEKHNVHTFLNKVAIATDTTKVGNLDKEELGTTPYSLRTYKSLQLAADKLADDDLWADYFGKKSEILSATSLSKDATLIKLAVTQNRTIGDLSKMQRKQNKSWFKQGNTESQ